MINNISSATQAQPVAQTKQADTKLTKSTQQPTPNATVQISNAAKALLQEATETQVQTAQEARGGDLQAQRLLAREAAEAAAKK